MSVSDIHQVPIANKPLDYFGSGKQEQFRLVSSQEFRLWLNTLGQHLPLETFRRLRPEHDALGKLELGLGEAAQELYKHSSSGILGVTVYHDNNTVGIHLSPNGTQARNEPYQIITQEFPQLQEAVDMVLYSGQRDVMGLCISGAR